ncbi:MAG: ROK family glucokinase [Lachnospiraceae bacterium]|nr:ROK family glucokinase [Lachnospiraceae bacterium]
MKYGIGIDVGGTTCKLGLFDSLGKLHYKWQVPTERERAKQLPATLISSIEEVKKERAILDQQIAGIGIALPAPVTAEGKVGRLTNIDLDAQVLIETLKEQLQCVVKVGNDANVAALGELHYGAGKGEKNLVMVTLGTGVGGGIIMDGNIVCGVHGAGGEIGHIKVKDREKRRCGCGKCGCLEQYVSATGIVTMARDKMEQGMGSDQWKEEVSAKDIFDLAKAGDEPSLQVVDEVGRILGKALATVACVVDPDVFVIGGGVSLAGDILPQVVQRYFREYAFPSCDEILVKQAVLGNDAGIFGCMGLIFQL